MQRVYEENEWGKVSKRIITVVSPSYIEFSKIFGPVYLIHQFRNQGKWVSIFDCPFVQISIVLAGL